MTQTLKADQVIEGHILVTRMSLADLIRFQLVDNLFVMGGVGRQPHKYKK